MDRLDKEHPMYSFLKEQGGEISAKGMEEFLQELYKSIFEDTNKYKELRNYMEKLDLQNGLNQAYSYSELIALEKLLFHLYPFLASFRDSEETLKKKWPNIAERWFLLNNKSCCGCVGRHYACI